MPATPSSRVLVPATRNEDLELLKLALLEQSMNERPGRTPSALAQNAYFASIPRTAEQEREQSTINAGDFRYNRSRMASQDREEALANERAKASMRQFETRRNVREPATESSIPFTPENFPAVSSRQTPTVVRKIQRLPVEPVDAEGPGTLTRFGTEQPARSIRRFTDTGGAFTDPDAAMGARERAELSPTVLAARARYPGGTSGASALAQMVQDNPELLKSLSPTARTAILSEIANSGGALGPNEQQREAVDTAREVQRIANALRTHPGLPGAFGVIQSKVPTIRQATADAETLRNSLQGLLTLENMGKMKGVLSDADMKIVRQASTTLSAEMSDPAAQAELKRLADVMAKVSGSSGGADNNGSSDSGAGAVTTDPYEQYLQRRRR